MKVFKRKDIALIVAQHLAFPDDQWFVHDPRSSNRRVAFKTKLMATKVSDFLLTMDLVPYTTRRAAKTILSMLLRTILAEIATEIGANNAHVHGFHDSAEWGDSLHTRGSGIVLTDAGLRAYRAAAGKMSARFA